MVANIEHLLPTVIKSLPRVKFPGKVSVSCSVVSDSLQPHGE